jgi:hypothetical protein
MWITKGFLVNPSLVCIKQYSNVSDSITFKNYNRYNEYRFIALTPGGRGGGAAEPENVRM